MTLRWHIYQDTKPLQYFGMRDAWCGHHTKKSFYTQPRAPMEVQEGPKSIARNTVPSLMVKIGEFCSTRQRYQRALEVLKLKTKLLYAVLGLF